MRTWLPIVVSSLVAFAIAFGGTLLIGGSPVSAVTAGLLVASLSAGLLASQVLRQEGTFDPRRRDDGRPADRPRDDGR